MRRRFGTASVLCAAALATVFSSASVAATLTGRVLYNGQPVVNYSPDVVQGWIRNEISGQGTPYVWTYNVADSTYSIPDMAPGVYGVQTSIFAPDNSGYFPGNYYGWKSPIVIPAGADTVILDLEITKLIHLVSPIDNRLREQMPPPYDVYYKEDIRFAWEPLAEAASYRYLVSEYATSPDGFVRPILEETTSDTSVLLSLARNQPNHDYMFDVQAYSSDGTFVGRIMIVYFNGIGWDYRFVIDWPTPESITQVIGDTPDSAFANNAEQRQKAFTEKLAQVQVLIEEGDYTLALDKLVNDIRAKMDGCSGGNPNNDWIVDCEAQARLLPLVDALIEYVKSLI